MFQLKDYPFVYFIGIGGIGMSGLAQFLRSQGHQVFGYDKAESTLVSKLQQQGIGIHHDDLVTSIPTIIHNNPDQTLIIYTPAITIYNNAILNHLTTNHYLLKSRAAVLGAICQKHPTLAVAGTHGKTTTSAMISHILYQSNIPICSFIGGIIETYDTNLLHNCLLEEVEWVIAEADEFNKSFLSLQPTHSIITTVDADHTDTYPTLADMEKNFLQFMAQTTHSLLIQDSVAHKLQIKSSCTIPLHTYGLNEGDIRASHLTLQPDQSRFTYVGPQLSIADLCLPMAGLHNIENALAAITFCLAIGLSERAIAQAIASFPGIGRRFSLVFKNDRCVYLDDYAHHPTEIDCLLTSVKKIYPTSTILAVFQPHLFSRTLAFYPSFAASLSLADQLVLLPIYPAREVAIPNVTSKMIFNSLTCKTKELVTMDSLLDRLTSYVTHSRDHLVIVTIGAGDIGEKVTAIADTLQRCYAKSVSI
ncbi:MAG: UDP-N-acetylmuramate--L-alanine ligase [Amoebophilaceae bacterium]|nr:UDP-N-acetylmuramate--L-alanine ligase [Amoebophilaceae bacterium]